jgi:hypothetical protein
MKPITRQHVVTLLELFKHGLIGTAGNQMTEFCVQQAVHRVIDGDLEDPHKDANPPNWCVHGELVSFGVMLNDYDGWSNSQARAKGLQKFAIAELGSSKISWTKFKEKLDNKLKELNPDYDRYRDGNHLEEWMGNTSGGMGSNDKLTLFANTAAEVLMEMGTDGSQFLHLVDEPNPIRRRMLAHKLGDKTYAAQTCSFGRCTPVTKAKL